MTNSIKVLSNKDRLRMLEIAQSLMAMEFVTDSREEAADLDEAVKALHDFASSSYRPGEDGSCVFHKDSFEIVIGFVRHLGLSISNDKDPVVKALGKECLSLSDDAC